MTDIAIRVENLSKKFHIGALKKNRNLREALVDGFKAPFRRAIDLIQGQAAGASELDETIWALKDVSFEIRRGETVGIIGGNGAGKSTLLKIISRITEPTEGFAEIHGRIGSLLEVGTGFHPELTGRENIYLNGAILGMKKTDITRKFDEIVSFSGVEKFIDTPVKHYSSGMYLRLAFAVAAHMDPETLVVDEVLAVGDMAFQKKCLGKMKTVSSEGRTVLFVSHNMIAINSLCRRAIWINGGKIMEDGPSEQVVTKYLAEFVESTGTPEKVWDEVAAAPGNDMVRLHRVCVRPQSGRTSDPLTVETPFLVEVEYWNLIADVQLHICLEPFTDRGDAAFETDSYDSDWGDRPMPIGLFRSVCYIPGDLMNSGIYRIAVLVQNDSGSVIYRYEEGVTVDILDTRKRKYAWHGKRIGTVSPVLRWTLECLREDPGIKVTANEHQYENGSP
jgi:lipopolysaccharide transport system ATP-binding protein